MAAALTSLEGGVPRWLVNRIDNFDLNSGSPARMFQYLHDANTPRSRALLKKFDAIADQLGLDDTLLDLLLEDLGLECAKAVMVTQGSGFGEQASSGMPPIE